ncbi:MAG: OstA-like protein [Bacteroidales bacterium]|nr:OstA-like protein [Bacteroidales bacterium]MDD3914258.1 OstA-like protein [Bacteroidales bacterium]MDD4633427.1 OstA-like protein [Bacteroidales bacterium]
MRCAKSSLECLLLLVLCVFVFDLTAYSQEQDTVPQKQNTEKKPVVIKLLGAEYAKYDKARGRNIQHLYENVRFQHDSAYMFCDSAYFNKEDNNLEAFGNVHLIENDTINLYGKHLIYDGNTRLAEINENVSLIDPTTVLKTDILFFDRNAQCAFYKSGATINNGDKDLVSKYGYYYLNTKAFDFFESVVMTNPKYRLESDTVFYNTVSEVAKVVDKTVIYNQNNTLYCYNGIYDSKKEKSYLKDSVLIYYNEYIIESDSLYYDNNIEYAEAYENVQLTDTVNSLKTWSKYCEFSKHDNYAFIADSAIARLINQPDTFYIYADTLKALFDIDSEELQYFYAYKDVKLYNDEVQAVCDSLAYLADDSVAIMYYKPVMWSGDNQITGDSIVFYIKNEDIDKIYANPNGFIITEDTLGRFNQIKGASMNILIKNKGIDKVDIKGSSNTVYFLREDDGSLIGPTIINSEDVIIYFDNGDLSQLIYTKEPNSELMPEEKSAPTKEKLDGFNWRINEKPIKGRIMEMLKSKLRF